MSRLQVEAMSWLRYGKRLPIVTTEVGRWNADVLGVSDTMSIEVEIKVSLSDLRRDFATKGTKHYYYANASETTESVPNYFYFFVPERLEQAAGEVLADKAPKAGLAVHLEDSRLLSGRNIRIAKKATRLRQGRPSPALLQVALARMSSELCGCKQALEGLKENYRESFERLCDDLTLGAARIAGTLDCEVGLEQDLEQRAAELAQAVEQKAWDQIEDKNKWREAAKRWLDAQHLNNREWRHEAFRR